jgi:ubiquinone/menaquinone biosynthesis C-methylase UbiE
MPNVETETKNFYANCKERHYSHPVIQAFSQPKVKWIMSHVNLSSKKVLEVGAGNGYLSHQLMKGCDLTVLDSSKHQLVSNPAAKKQVGSVYALPYKDASYDTIVCSNLLHHLDEPLRAIKEIKRVATRHVIISEPNINNPILFFVALFRKSERNVIQYTKRYLEKLIKNSNMHIMKHTYIGGNVIANGTPPFFLPLAGANSTSRLSLFQMFVCAKNGANY